MQTIYLLHLEEISIFERLQIEEALVRTSSDCYCVLGKGSSSAIVMGLSGKEDELVSHLAFEHGIPVIKRFTGGGTVFVDKNTFFSTFIFSKEANKIQPFPDKIMSWSAHLYKKAFSHPDFSLLENDYVMGEHKCGGNAQYISKDRWLHHTSFLWDYKKENMDYLLFPSKTPKYRKGRAHHNFMCKLCDFFPSIEYISEKIENVLNDDYLVKKISLEEVKKNLDVPHRKSTVILKKTI
ncbi:MAG: lipoyl protein ligase domain-containing protein [Rhabdochlamydiaceae bacterium]